MGKRPGRESLSQVRIGSCRRPTPFLRPAARIVGGFLLIGVLVAGAGRSVAGESPSQAVFAARAERVLVAARARFLADTNSAEAGWQYARACFDRGEFATNNVERAKIASQGIAVSRQLVTQQPGLAAGHYYLAMNLGQLARTRTLGALKLVDQMEAAFLLARALDEQFDFAGPHRNLGVLYLEAPVIGSVGSRTRASRHLVRAAELAPDYPENRLNLVEAFWRWGDRDAARRELRTLEELWPKSRRTLSGESWEPIWADWERRLAGIRRKIHEEAAE